MRKLLITLVAAFALTTAASAFASTSPGNGPATGGGVKAKGATTVKYVATYVDPFFGPVRCTGVRQTKTTFGVQDSFTCDSTTGSPLANTYPSEALDLSVFGGWISDYDGVYAVSFAGAVSVDGMSETAVANY